MPRHISWKYRFHGKFWELTRKILRSTACVHACKNEVIIERYCSNEAAVEEEQGNAVFAIHFAVKVFNKLYVTSKTKCFSSKNGRAVWVAKTGV